MPILISFSGLPGVGKTTIAKALTQQIPALYLRVDVVEPALRESALQIEHAEDAGYRAICGIAVCNLKLGQNISPLVGCRLATRQQQTQRRRLCATDRVIHRAAPTSRRHVIDIT